MLGIGTKGGKKVIGKKEGTDRSGSRRTTVVDVRHVAKRSKRRTNRVRRSFPTSSQLS